MKTYIFLFILVLSMVMACKSKKETSNTSSNESISNSTSTNKVHGKVSHQYRSSGCETVIIISESGSNITLIPDKKLASEFDIDGMNISFDYITLRMPQPEGCANGVPAQLSNISKKR